MNDEGNSFSEDEETDYESYPEKPKRHANTISNIVVIIAALITAGGAVLAAMLSQGIITITVTGIFGGGGQPSGIASPTIQNTPSSLTLTPLLIPTSTDIPILAETPSLSPSPTITIVLTSTETIVLTSTLELSSLSDPCMARKNAIDVAIHVGPDKDRNVRGSLQSNISYPVIGQHFNENENASWWQIRSDTTHEADRYWVEAARVSISGNCTHIPIVATPVIILLPTPTLTFTPEPSPTPQPHSGGSNGGGGQPPNSGCGGYDDEGYNACGYDREGYDREGYNAAGYDREGYDRDGYNAAGYDREGCDRDGYCQ